MNFENLQLNYESIPNIEEVDFKKVERKYLNVIIGTTAIVFLIIAILIALILYFNNELRENRISVLIISIIYFCLLAFFILTALLGFKFRGYAIRQYDILYKSGLIFQKTDIVPYNKVQHCIVIEGLISRQFGLANLKIYTAASNNRDVSINGLKKEQAQQIKDLIMKQNGEINEA